MDHLTAAEKHRQLREMVSRMGFHPQYVESVIAQLYEAVSRYYMKPMVVPDPAPLNSQVQGAAGQSRRSCVRLSGKLVITVENREYKTPVHFYIQVEFPHVYPIVYVRPYQGAVLRQNHPYVHPTTGYVDLSSPSLPAAMWGGVENSLGVTIRRLQSGFSSRPPLREDPVHAERRQRVGTLTPQVHERMVQETDDAKRQFVELQSSLQKLRGKDVLMSTQIRRKAAEAGGGVGTKLAAVRESAIRIDALTKEYGVDEENPDIDLDDLMRLSSGHPLRDQVDDLNSEDKSFDDALTAVMNAFEEKCISMDMFLKQTKILATQQFRVRARLHKVGQDMHAAVVAEQSNSHSGSSGGGTGGDDRAGRSLLMTSGIFPKRFVARGMYGAAPPGQPPAPGPPVSIPASDGSRLTSS